MAEDEKPPEGPQSGSAEPAAPVEQNAPEKPAAPAAEKTAAAAEEPAPKPAVKKVAKKPAVMETTPWEGELAGRIKGRFSDRVGEPLTYREQDFIVADLDAVEELLTFLRDEEDFDYLVDLTAVDYPNKEKRFEVVWILYSFSKNARVRVKALVAEGEKAPTATKLYSTSNWAEREVFDMFGIEFEGHPNMTRILMPDEWDGYPLRKDYGLIQQDEGWVRENLNIESAQ